MEFDENLALERLGEFLKQYRKTNPNIFAEFNNWKLQLLKLRSKGNSFIGLSPTDDYELRKIYDGLNRIALAIGKYSFTDLGIGEINAKNEKDYTIPSEDKEIMQSTPKTDLQFDVAISCAGEDTVYIDQVADCLRSENVKVFYYKFEDVQVELWGKDLYVHLDEIYRKKAKFCVMFLSKNYAAKVWTSHERRSAQARAFEENKEYILPVRFDNTEVPGIVPTVSYIDANRVSPQQLCELIKRKLNTTI